MLRVEAQFGIRGVALLAAAVLLVCLACPAKAQQQAPASRPAAAQDRMTDLAKRFASVDAPASTPKPAAAPAEPAAAASRTVSSNEQLPLGHVSATRETEALPADTDSDSGWPLKTLAALGAIIGLILLIRWGYAKMGGRVVSRPSGAVEVLSRTSVAPRNHVVLLRVGGRVLVVSDSSGGLRTLAEVTEPEEVASLIGTVSADKPTSVSAGFKQMLSSFNNDYSERERTADEGGDHQEHQIDSVRSSVSGVLSQIRGISQRRGA